MKVKLKIFRLNPETDKEPHFDGFEVEAKPNDRILDCLNKVRWEQDSSLAFRMSCAHGICGSDGLTINGVAALACQKLVRDYDFSKEILVEPLKFFTVVKDLVVDLQPFFQRMKQVEIHEESPPDELPTKERLQTIEERALFDDAVKCILCACCVAACPVLLKEDGEFIGPEAILRAHRYIFDSRTSNVAERMQVLDRPHGVWGCKTYYMCTKVCPKKIKVTEAILKTKTKVIKELHSKPQ